MPILSSNGIEQGVPTWFTTTVDDRAETVSSSRGKRQQSKALPCMARWQRLEVSKRVMIDKDRGRLCYAVGYVRRFPRLGEDYLPSCPGLKFGYGQARLMGTCVNITGYAQLNKAPRFSRAQAGLEQIG